MFALGEEAGSGTKIEPAFLGTYHSSRDTKHTFLGTLNYIARKSKPILLGTYHSSRDTKPSFLEIPHSSRSTKPTFLGSQILFRF